MATLRKELGSLDRIGQVVHSLSAEIKDLEGRLVREDGELLACVVGGASRMQELVIDLLAISQFAYWPLTQEAPLPPEKSPEVFGAIQLEAINAALPNDDSVTAGPLAPAS